MVWSGQGSAEPILGKIRLHLRRATVSIQLSPTDERYVLDYNILRVLRLKEAEYKVGYRNL